MSPITPSIIKKVLRKRPSSSSPGDDGITYHHLKMMPPSHHLLATLFSKLFLCSHVPPTLWTHAKIIMIHKKVTPQTLQTSALLHLTSVVRKLFHKILANRLECYLILNEMIDKSLQTGFLSGVNGVLLYKCTSFAFTKNAQGGHKILKKTL